MTDTNTDTTTPMDRMSELRLSQVHPRLADTIRQLAANLRIDGIYIRVVQGLRTVAQQDALYAQGRTSPGHIVTNAPGGHSYHNFGLAVDCAPMAQDSTIDWNAEHPAWKAMEKAGIALGLTSGATWVRLIDAPHFQLTGAWPVGAPTDAVRSLLQTGGLAAVWHELDRQLTASDAPVLASATLPTTTTKTSATPPTDTTPAPTTPIAT